MKPEDLGQKKINNEQKLNEGFSGNNLPEDYNPAAEKHRLESETNKKGDHDHVFRARHTEKPIAASSDSEELSDGDDAKMKTAQNRDFNSDVAKDRYPAGHEDHQHDRGNVKLDE